ncbi:MAG: radical SAM protein, partial [Patescibacteria group bacterium]
MTTYLAISTPIIKPVNGSCNLSCSYCYAAGLRKQTRENRMHPETLKATIDFFCRDQDNIEFIWHGGEPLLAGIDFYRKAMEYQQSWEQKGKRIINSIQTNATLITPNWIKFFAEHNFSIGVSLDGPKDFHNQARYYPDKTGSYDNVMRGIELLRQAGIFSGIICGISTVNHQFPKEVFNFLISQDIRKLKFARVKDIVHCNDISSFSVSQKQY